MKSFAFSVFLISISIYSIGQSSKIDICGVYKYSLRNSSLDSITHIINLDSTQVNNYEKSELLTMRARLHFYLDRSEIDKRTTSDHPSIIKAHKDLSLAIDQYKDEKDKLRYVFRRFIMLDNYKPHYKEYDSDLDLLTSNGFRNDKFGFALTAVSKYDGDLWLGIEASFAGGYTAPYTLKDDYKQIIHKRKASKSASALVFGYSRNIVSNMGDLNFTLLRLEAPLFADVTQFGFIHTEGTTHWYYRPELGIGYSIFHLSAGYTFYFKGHKSRNLSKSIFNLRVKHTF